MKEPGKRKFTIDTRIDGKDYQTEVNYKETTDGLPYYSCQINGKEVQLRKDGKWEQIWGDLNPQAVEEIGNAIDKIIL